jgi:hypothetical protein
MEADCGIGDLRRIVRKAVRKLKCQRMYGTTAYTIGGLWFMPDFGSHDRCSHEVVDLEVIGTSLWAEIAFLRSYHGRIAQLALHGLVGYAACQRRFGYDDQEIVGVNLGPCATCLGKGYIDGIGGRSIPCEGCESRGHATAEDLERAAHMMRHY